MTVDKCLGLFKLRNLAAYEIERGPYFTSVKIIYVNKHSRTAFPNIFLFCGYIQMAGCID